jgi:RNA polymerase sigma-70 factor (ECF subfamily)
MMDATSEEQDRSDMARLAADHDAALNDLMRRHAERLFHYLLRILQNETEAADLAEETFVRVYQNRTRFRPQNKFTTWLYTIATNLARDLQRHRARHPHVSLEAQNPGTDHDFREALPDTAPNPGETLDSAERAKAVQSAVAELPEDLRVPLVLSVYEDKSHAEIGEILACSAKAVEMRLYRARQELRNRLEKSLPFPGKSQI